MKNTILFLTLLSTTLVYGQESSIQENIRLENRHQLTVTTEANTGTLVDNTDGIFAGNELALSFEYRYMFMSVPWLSIFSKIGFIGSMSFNNININLEGPNAKPGNEGIVDPKYKFNGFNSASVGVDYFETGLNLSDYGMVSIRVGKGGETPTSATPAMLLKFYGYYPLHMTSTQDLSFIAGIEINPFPVGQILNPGDPNLQTEGKNAGTYVDLLTFGINYSIGMGKGFSYTTGLHVRTGGQRYKLSNSATGNIWEPDTLEAFRNNLLLRWENTFSYNFENTFVLWAQVRYQAERIAIGQESTSIYELTKQHEVFLRFGLSYYFNFASKPKSQV